jgi:hypothetical protein
MGSRARVTGATVKDSNDKPPYRHWHVVCAACGKITLARPCKVPSEIDPVEHNRSSNVSIAKMPGNT